MSDTRQHKSHQLGLIGGGNMAYALASGLIAKGFAATKICVADPAPEQLERMAGIGVDALADSRAVASAAEHLVLAVKPQQMSVVLSELAGTVSAKQMVLSVAAGVNIDQIRAGIGQEQLPITRAMPNTPVLVGEGATALYGEHLSDEQRNFATEIMAAVGLVLWVQEEVQLAAITAVSGSGPAYFLALMEEMVRVGVELGLSNDAASAMVKQTALGAARLALESEHDLATLRSNVTSPGGTTEAALAVFAQQDFPNLITAALGAARARAIELAKENT